jgi:Cft2 family RNA processing exonuclease
MIQILDRNLHVRAIDAYIDPAVPRERAIITHGHADHARAGHGAVLATPDTIAIMKVRYGEDCAGRFEPLDHHSGAGRPYPGVGAGAGGAGRAARGGDGRL